MIPAMFLHQADTVDRQCSFENGRGFNTSDPGTGKTRSCLETFKRKGVGRLLVLAPLTILEASWGKDIETFLPGFRYRIAHGTATKRKAAILDRTAHIVLTNIDAVNWIVTDKDIMKELAESFSMLCVDEFTAYKNANAKRSKAAFQVAKTIPGLIMMSGTPNPKTILDMWFPAMMVDGGKRLGAKYWQFRGMVCTPTQVGPDPKMIRWDDKEGAQDFVADMLKDITVRYRFEDCIDIPENFKYTKTLIPPKWLMDKYKELERTNILETEEGRLNAIHAGARMKKMLQLLSGAVYGEDGAVLKVHDERYALVMDLIEERGQCLVAFNWKHELAKLKEHADRLEITYGVINGDASPTERAEVVEQFQRGELKCIFAHPQSASHGLTLTRGTTTIWCSPTYNAEHYEQFNRRIYRAGQTEKTETIRIAYAGTKEEEVYEKLDIKLDRMDDLLSLFNVFSQNHIGAPHA